MDKLSMEYQYQLFLEHSDLSEDRMSPSERDERRYTFFGAFGQALIFMRDIVADLPEERGIELVHALLNEAMGKFRELGQQLKVQPVPTAPNALSPTGCCMYDDCKAEAEFTVHYELRAYKGSGVATSGPIFRVCAPHSEMITWGYLYSEENWQRIVDAFIKMGRMAPSKKDSGIALIPIKRNTNG